MDKTSDPKGKLLVVSIAHHILITVDSTTLKVAKNIKLVRSNDFRACGAKLMVGTHKYSICYAY